MFFNGQHRRTPVVSLGGNSRINNREALLEHAAQERKKRQEQKKMVDSAARIQRAWRSHRDRVALKRKLQIDFSTSTLGALNASRQPVTAATLGRLVVQLGVLYNDSLDSAQLLIQVCTLLLRHQQTLQRDIAEKRTQWALRLRHLLLLVLQFLARYASTSDLSISAPLRLLEVLLHPKLYSAVGQESVLESLVVYLCQHGGYFSTMLHVLLVKLPAPMEYSSRAPSPFADGLLGVLTLPLHSAELHRDAVLTQLCRELLPLSCHPIVRLYILPALSDRLPLADLLRAAPNARAYASDAPAHGAAVPGSSTHSVFPARQPPCFPGPENSAGWALYGLLQVTECSYLSSQNGSNEATKASIPALLETASNLLPAVAPAHPPNVMAEQQVESVDTSASDEEANDAWSSAEAALASRIPPYLVPHFLQGQCRRLLTSSRLSRTVVNLFSHSNDEVIPQSYFSSLASVCSHYLLYQPAIFRRSQLYEDLCFQPTIVRQLWQQICNYTLISPSGSRTPLLELIQHSVYSPSASVAGYFIDHLATFSALLMAHLSSVDADTFKSGAMVFSVAELSVISRQLLDVSLSLLRSDTLGVTKVIAECLALDMAVVDRFGGVLPMRRKREVSPAAVAAESRAVSPYAWAMLFQLMSSFLRSLHARDARTKVFPFDHWLASTSQFDFNNLDLVDPSKIFTEAGDSATPSTVTSAQTVIILRTLPFITPFLERATLFLELVFADKQANGHRVHGFLHHDFEINVRRSHVYEDAFSELCAMSASDLKRDISVHLTNFHGLSEAGIDGGGILREFLTVFVQEAFDSSKGLFKYTDDKHIYPNPGVKMVFHDPLLHYKFLGKMLGKVMYENLLVDLPFASFFVQKVIDGSKAPLSFDHLESLDPQVYKNLLFLRTYQGDIADLSLNFTIVNNDVGQSEVVELKPGGSNITVTNDNYLEYIAAVANYKLNIQIESQCTAFREGFASMVNIAWLRLFTATEAQILISGAPVPLDLEDLQRNINYSGGYHAHHITIKAFWEAVSTFSPEQLQQLLKFVTSCSRPPLLGFEDFHPKFAIHNAISVDRLPTASTCMNLLKLPPYEDAGVLKERLLYAISAGAGFELS